MVRANVGEYFGKFVVMSTPEGVRGGSDVWHAVCNKNNAVRRWVRNLDPGSRISQSRVELDSGSRISCPGVEYLSTPGRKLLNHWVEWYHKHMNLTVKTLPSILYYIASLLCSVHSIYPGI